MTPAQRAQIMPHEVHDTVNAYLAGKIDQWYFRTDGKSVVFIVKIHLPGILRKRFGQRCWTPRKADGQLCMSL